MKLLADGACAQPKAAYLLLQSRTEFAAKNTTSSGLGRVATALSVWRLVTVLMVTPGGVRIDVTERGTASRLTEDR